MRTMTSRKLAFLEHLYERHPEETVKQQCEKALLKHLIMNEREHLAQRQAIIMIRGGKR